MHLEKAILELNIKFPRLNLLPKKTQKRIHEYIEYYGATLIDLPEETWDTSVCLWMEGYWDVLIDLFTLEEGASDLVLAARVYEESNQMYIYEIDSIYVP